MSFLSRIFQKTDERGALAPLYGEVVASGRDPVWYREGRVPDTIDGRFDMIAAVLTLLLLRLEQEGEAAGRASVMLAELFIADMEGSIRQIGIGDLMVGKNVGKMMSALGGRLTAFRTAIAEGRGLDAPVRRNIFHDSPPDEACVGAVAARLDRLRRALADTPLDALLAGTMPKP